MHYKLARNSRAAERAIHFNLHLDIYLITSVRFEKSIQQVRAHERRLRRAPDAPSPWRWWCRRRFDVGAVRRRVTRATASGRRSIRWQASVPTFLGFCVACPASVPTPPPSSHHRRHDPVRSLILVLPDRVNLAYNNRVCHVKFRCVN